MLPSRPSLFHDNQPLLSHLHFFCVLSSSSSPSSMPTTTTANPPSPPNTHASPVVIIPCPSSSHALLLLWDLCKLQQEKHREALSQSFSLVWHSIPHLLLAYAQTEQDFTHWCTSIFPSLYLPSSRRRRRRY
ncbi:hypothetical protein CSAL01_13125 [Colletotrichum salicis]|uniref:Uncharacterized protein n=1 Tax=Colletotrichum salicis TaxID=1209931 RepID=A0A135V0Q2_9PEZI|nr:hypothetical protein CSAL01_13125 [Colletotrichum salicis]